MRVSDTLAFLCGEWHLDRVLHDHRSGLAGRFTGRALVVPGRRGGLSYGESGELSFGGHTGPAQRRLRLVPAADGAAEVRFADGRFFYLLDLRAGHWQAEHGCGEDRYLLAHRVLGEDRLEEEWRVRGPAKDYLAITQFRRKPLQNAPVHRTMDGNVT
jgi:Family of unknown function (DUF6314)